jgi:hypothetical protein
VKAASIYLNAARRRNAPSGLSSLISGQIILSDEMLARLGLARLFIATVSSAQTNAISYNDNLHSGQNLTEGSSYTTAVKWEARIGVMVRV